VYFKLHEMKHPQRQSRFLFPGKQTSMVLIANCVNLLSDARTASGIWECL